MSLLRRGNKDQPAETPPPPAAPTQSAAGTPPAPDDAAQPSGQPEQDQPKEEKKTRTLNPFKWLWDNYYPVYQIVLKPELPPMNTIVTLMLGVVLGLIWAYGINPPVFVDGGPHQMSQAAQDQWIIMTAAGYDQDFYSDEAARQLLDEVANPAGRVQALLNGDRTNFERQVLQAVQPIAANVDGTPIPEGQGLLVEIAIMVALVLIVGFVAILLALAWNILIYSNIVAPIRKRIRMATDKDYAAEVAKEQEELQRLQQQAQARKDMQARAAQQAADAEARGEKVGPMVMQQLSIYNQGRDYDDSFEIELSKEQGGAFLGQCGAAIPESIYPDPKAVEVWLFDMSSQQNRNKIFITEAAANDPSVKGRLSGDVDDPDSDIIVVEPGGKLIIESKNIRLQAMMADVNTDASGQFENFRMELAAWQKGEEVAATPAPAGAPPMPPPGGGMPQPASAPSAPPQQPPPPPGGSSPQPLQPPPLQPQQPPQQAPQQPPQQAPQAPPPPGMQPLQPPPLRPQQNPQQPPMPPPPGEGNYPYSQDDDDDDDDPFGGTGDFTPLGRP